VAGLIDLQMGSDMDEISYSQRLLRQAKLMARMMERIGVDPTRAAGKDGGLSWYEGQAKCIFCRRAERCSEWLDGMEPLARADEFCPNIKFFRFCCADSLTLAPM
jgi:hypothetical protein